MNYKEKYKINDEINDESLIRKESLLYSSDINIKHS